MATNYIPIQDSEDVEAEAIPTPQIRHPILNTKRILISFAALFLLGVFLSILSFAIPQTNPVVQNGRLIIAKQGAVSSENPICSSIGVDVLKEGGSAVDAIIATTLCIGTVNPYSSGIGGGGFAVIRNSNGHAEAIDFREEAPMNAHTDMFNSDPKRAQLGGLSVAIPGEIKGLAYLHEKYGVLEWSRLFEPSWKLALYGWNANDVLSSRLADASADILKDETLKSVFSPNGYIIKPGELIKRETYGSILEKIGKLGRVEGVDAFYTGYIAKTLISTINSKGGNMTHQDFAQYQVKTSKPLTGYYQGRKVSTMPLPAGGPVLLSILNIIEGYQGFSKQVGGIKNTHYLIEAFKHAYAQRTYYGDPVDKIYKNITEIMHQFTDKAHAYAIRANISDNNTYPVEHYNPAFQVKEDHGTMHVSVIDKNGQAVSLTSTINLLLGSRVMDPTTGILLNDEMDDFSIPNKDNAFGLPPSPYNFIQPGKRPLSSCSPTIIEKDGQIELIVGASGGSFIISAVANVIINVLNYGKNPKDAINDPRPHHQLLPNTVLVEPKFDATLASQLQDLGHTVVRMASTRTGVSAIQRLKDGTLLAAGDSRKGGEASGY